MSELPLCECCPMSELPLCECCGAPATCQTTDGVFLCQADWWHMVDLDNEEAAP